MHIPTNQGFNGITGNTNTKTVVDAVKSANTLSRVLPHVGQAFYQVKVTNAVKDAAANAPIIQATRAAIDNAAPTGTHSAAAFQAQAPAKPYVAPTDIRNSTQAFEQFLNGDVQLLMDIGNYARTHPKQVASIGQAYIDVWGEKLGELRVSSFLGDIAEANDGSPGAKSALERLSRIVNSLASDGPLNIPFPPPHIPHIPNIPPPHPGVDTPDNNPRPDHGRVILADHIRN